MGVLERFLYHRPQVRLVLTTSTADAQEVTLWRSGAAVHNILLGLGLAAGVVVLHAGDETAGRTLVLFLCAFLVVSAVVLAVPPRGCGAARSARGRRPPSPCRPPRSDAGPVRRARCAPGAPAACTGPSPSAGPGRCGPCPGPPRGR
ncbi:DUF1304 family protein [Streptomyces sp. NPDC055952]|uniref:DUF1304 family protein n=1 Tax=Streptomyces sp. NPDC055952 TaxID=3345663 RepID=UPI0035DF2436